MRKYQLSRNRRQTIASKKHILKQKLLKLILSVLIEKLLNISQHFWLLIPYSLSVHDLKLT